MALSRGALSHQKLLWKMTKRELLRILEAGALRRVGDDEADLERDARVAAVVLELLVDTAGVAVPCSQHVGRQQDLEEASLLPLSHPRV